VEGEAKEEKGVPREYVRDRRVIKEG